MGIDILLVEDDSAQRGWMQASLRSAGYRVDAAGSVEEGFKKALELRPRLIVTDIQLPDQTGFDLCRRARAQAPLQDVRIVMITGTYHKDEDRLRADKLGADAYLLKPFHARQLLQAVQSLLPKTL